MAARVDARARSPEPDCVGRGETFSLSTIASGGGAIHSLTTGAMRPGFIGWGNVASG
jgi:hypothetical protein